jgi:transcriptional regulator with XRE-family HTH domain
MVAWRLATWRLKVDFDLHIGRRLRSRRKLLGYTQNQLAAACAVRFQQVQKYECGMNRISAARLWLAARFLKTPIDYFFEGLASERHAPSEPFGHRAVQSRDAA